MTETFDFENRPLIEQTLYKAGKEIEEFFGSYPCLKEVCYGLETAARPAALFVGAAFLGTLMTRCTYKFYFQPEALRRLNYAVFIVGDPGTGKSFAAQLYKILAEPIIRESRKGMNTMNRYKRKRKQWEDGGMKGDGPKQPHPLIRTHPARTSNKVFISDMIHAVDIVDGQEMNLHMLSFDTELDNATNMQGEAWNNKFFMELKAFHNEEDGQFYSNNDSEIGNFYVYWNYVYTGTPDALHHKVNANNIGTGYATRLAAIPMPSTHFKMLKREKLDSVKEEPEEYKTLSLWAERLDKVHGELPIEKLVDCTYEWASRRMEDAEYNQSKTDELLLKRVPYYGINVSMPFIIMRHWKEWSEEGTITIDETDERFCMLIMNIQLACQRHFFGAYWDAYFELGDHALPPQKRHTKLMKNRYRLLPSDFCIYDLMDMASIQKRNAEKMLERWLKEGYIERIETGYYHKVFLELS